MVDYYVSPVEVAIAYLSLDATLLSLINSQIGVRHRFTTDASLSANDWSIDDPALTVRGSGGTSQKYVREQPANLECIAWARNYGKAYEVYGEVVRIVRDTQRTVVNGNLLLSLSLESQPTELLDESTNYPQVMFFLNCLVGENQEV